MKPLGKMNVADFVPNLISSNYYHYLVNRTRRRSASSIRHKHSSVINQQYFLYSILSLLSISIIISNALQIPSQSFGNSSLKTSTNQCVIGRLRQCNDDEDCVEHVNTKIPEIKVIVSSQNGSVEDVVHSATFVSKSPDMDNYERMGTCTCRNVRRCKRTQQQSPMIVPMSESDKLADRRESRGPNFGWIIATLFSITLIGGCAFAIYYYGIRYGMIRNIARQFGLTNNTQIEHQLLNRIPSSTEETELAI